MHVFGRPRQRRRGPRRGHRQSGPRTVQDRRSGNTAPVAGPTAVPGPHHPRVAVLPPTDPDPDRRAGRRLPDAGVARASPKPGIPARADVRLTAPAVLRRPAGLVGALTGSDASEQVVDGLELRFDRPAKAGYHEQTQAADAEDHGYADHDHDHNSGTHGGALPGPVSSRSPTDPGLP